MKKFAIAICAITVVLGLILPHGLVLGAEKPVVGNLLEGLTISVMGDSISTYMGWSDAYPITDAGCTNRYGEPYYGPVGSGCHNEELLVEDTWWHQAATQLGAKILMSNAGNSTGLLCASYPHNASWDLYLKELLAYKSRPYYLGKDGVAPNIIALYIGSNEAGRATLAQMGCMDDVNFDTLIQQNPDGTFTYAEPTTVTESYCILLHKISVSYPEAEVYCFTVVPNAGGGVNVGNSRIATCAAFNDVVREVAEYHGLILVDLFEEFDVDPDGDGVIAEADWNRFKTYYNNDPHPNAAGFDVITKCFVEAVQEHSRYGVSVQTKADLVEPVDVNTSKVSDEPTVVERVGHTITDADMQVDYKSTTGFFDESSGLVRTHEEEYTSSNGDYFARGGSTLQAKTEPPLLTVSIPMADSDDPATAGNDTVNTMNGEAEGRISTSGDIKQGDADGIYDYTEAGIQRSGSVSVTTSYISLSSDNIRTHEDLTYLTVDVEATDTNDMITGYKAVALPQTPEEVPEIKAGYDVVYLGSDKLSRFWSAHAYEAPILEDYPDELPIYSDDKLSLYVGANHDIFVNRNLLVPTLYLPHATVTGGPFPSRYDSVQQYTFSNADAEILTTYCADQLEAPIKGFSYRIVNLEDSDYYTPDEAYMLRTIGNNAYWGTSQGFGSLEALRGRLRASGQFTEEELSALTEGMAMTATQYAIWTFSNVMDDIVYTNAYYHNGSSIAGAGDDEDVALIMKLYSYFVSLPPTTPDPVMLRSTADTLINEKNFIADASVTVLDKPDTNSNNLDSDDSNDVYCVDIALALSVVPAENNGDDLLIKLDGIGTNPIFGRVVGELQPGEVMLDVDDFGRYVFRNVLIQEGAQQLEISMTGHQNLQRYPHLLVSENQNGKKSQTMIAIVEGKHSVSVSMELDFSVEVVDPISYTRHLWRTERISTMSGRENPNTGLYFRREKSISEVL